MNEAVAKQRTALAALLTLMLLTLMLKLMMLSDDHLLTDYPAY